MLRRMILTVLMVLFSACLSYAQQAQLWETGQTTCYDTAGNVIACTGTGQDGEIKAGVAWPSPRFTVSGDCVTDNLTGMMWTKNANLPGTYKAWQQALDYANNLTLCGYSDWRIPNRKELMSLIDRSKYYPALPSGHPFLNVQSNVYWSSTSFANYPHLAWFVNMWNGYMDFYNKTPNGTFYVWPVRSGQVGPLVHSIIGTVTENSMGLSGVTMTLGGDATATTTTATDGSYSFANLLDGSYTVNPAMDGYNFSPTSIDITMAGADITAVNFQAYLVPDTMPPTGSILINGNAVWTKTTAVMLTLDCTDSESGCVEMQVSNDGVFDTEPIEPVAASKSWTLPSGDGNKKVYVRYRDVAGNVSARFSDTIYLDTAKPVVSGVSDSPDPFNHHLGEVSTINYTVSDNLSVTCTIGVAFFNSSNIEVRRIIKNNVSCPTGGASGSFIWDGKDKNGVLVPAGSYTYKIQARDRASNSSAIKQGTSTVQ